MVGYTSRNKKSAAIVVANAIKKSQKERRPVRLDDYRPAVLTELMRKRDEDTCDGDGSRYWGHNKNGSWFVYVSLAEDEYEQEMRG